MTFYFTYSLTYENGQTNNCGRSQLVLETSKDETKKIIIGTINNIPLGKIPDIPEVIARMRESVILVDRTFNTDGSDRKVMLKKPRAIRSIDYYLSEDDVNRIKRLPDPIQALDAPKEHMTIPCSDGSVIELSYYFGTVSVTDKKHQSYCTSADSFASKLQW